MPVCSLQSVILLRVAYCCWHSLVSNTFAIVNPVSCQTIKYRILFCRLWMQKYFAWIEKIQHTTTGNLLLYEVFLLLFAWILWFSGKIMKKSCCHVAAARKRILTVLTDLTFIELQGLERATWMVSRNRGEVFLAPLNKPLPWQANVFRQQSIANFQNTCADSCMS